MNSFNRIKEIFDNRYNHLNLYLSNPYFDDTWRFDVIYYDTHKQLICGLRLDRMDDFTKGCEDTIVLLFNAFLRQKGLNPDGYLKPLKKIKDFKV